jgi:MFS family permease
MGFASVAMTPGTPEIPSFLWRPWRCGGSKQFPDLQVIMANLLASFRGAFTPLKLPNFRLYISAQLISNIGTFLQQVAQQWVVWELTRSEAANGIVALMNGLPVLLLTPLAGVWVDRLDRRKVLTATQIGMMLLAFTLAILVQTQTVQLWHVFVLSGLLGIVTTFDFTAHQTFLGDLSGMGEVRKAVAMNGMVLQSSRTFGGVIAAWLIAQWGAATAFWINGLSFIAVIISLSQIRLTNQSRSSHAKASPFGQLADALRFLRTQPRMQDMFIFSALIACGFWSIILSLLPSIADKVLGGQAQALGALTSASGVGALVSLLFVVPITSSLRRGGVVMTGALMLTGSAIIVLGLSNWLPLSMLAIGVATMGSPIVFPMALGLTQIMAPPDMRARLISLFTMISLGMQPVAALLIGALATVIGVQTVVVINGTLCIALTLLLLSTRRGLWNWQVGGAVPTIPVVPTPVESVSG